MYIKSHRKRKTFQKSNKIKDIYSSSKAYVILWSPFNNATAGHLPEYARKLLPRHRGEYLASHLQVGARLAGNSEISLGVTGRFSSLVFLPGTGSNFKFLWIRIWSQHRDPKKSLQKSYYWKKTYKLVLTFVEIREKSKLQMK